MSSGGYYSFCTIHYAIAIQIVLKKKFKTNDNFLRINDL